MEKDAASIIGYSISSELLYILADKNAKRSEDDDADALTALILAAMWLEAYINEIGMTIGIRTMPLPPQIESLRFGLVEKEMSSPTTKAKLFFRSFGGRPDPEILRRVQLLYDIRNALAHYRPSRLRIKQRGRELGTLYQEDPRDLLAGMKKEGLYPPTNFGPGADHLSWIYGVCQPATARWALATVQAMAVALADSFPDPKWRHSAHQRNPARKESEEVGGGMGEGSRQET